MIRLALVLGLVGCDAVWRIDHVPDPDADGDSPPPGSPPAFVQSAAADDLGMSNGIAKTFSAPVTAGNLVVAIVGWTGTPNVVTVRAGAAQMTKLAPEVRFMNLAQAIYYAENVPAGSGTIVVAFDSVTMDRDLRLLEYSGVATVSPVDAIAMGVGVGNAMTTDVLITMAPNEMIVAGATVGDRVQAPGLGFNERNITTNTGSLSEDRVADVPAGYTATAQQNTASNWVIQAVAFRGP